MDENDDGSGASDAPAGTMPKQKRRRVSRACDECRRKKIKCDGLQPCTHCAVYSYGTDPQTMVQRWTISLVTPSLLSLLADCHADCTYDKPSNRRRNPAPQYLEAVEARLHRAEALLRKFMPDVDLSDPSLDPLVQQEFRNRTRAKAQKMQATTAPAAQPPKRDVGARKEADSRDARDAQDAQDAQIMSMIETIGQLDLSDRGEWDFHGTSSSAVFLRRMKEHFKGLLGNDYRTPFLPRPPTRPRGLLRLDSPRSNPSSVWDTSALPNIYELPPQDRVKDLCRYSLECATCLLRIVHVPTFYSRLDRLYELPVNSWGNEENRFLGLMYAVMALGCMYTLSGPQVTFKTSTEEG